MQAARRLYLYAMSGIALAVTGVGLSLLIDVLITGSGVLEHPYDQYQSPQERISQAVAMLGVGIPVWAIHWWLVQRGLAPGRPMRDAERGSTIRAAYVTLVLAVGLLVWVSGAVGLVASVVLDVTGRRPENDYGGDPVGSTAWLAVGLVIWLYHGVVRRADLGAGSVEGPAAWIPRLYLYGVALGALVAALNGFSVLVERILTPDQYDPGYSTAVAIESGVVFVAWGLAWLGHWWYASRLAAAQGWRGEQERSSRTRIAAFVTTIGVAVAMTVAGLAEAFTSLLRPILDDAATEPDTVALLAGALASAVPWAVAWFAHTRLLAREPAAADPLRALHQVRLVSHTAAGVGLAFGATGLGWLVGLAIDVALGGSRTRSEPFNGSWQTELSSWLPIAVVGLAVWVWQWSSALARRRRDPDGEANSTIRRAFLYLTLAVALVSALGSATLILYRLVGTIIGANLTGDAVSELSTPVGAFSAAAIVFLYHGLLLRADQARRPAEPAEPAAAVAALATVATGLEPSPGVGETVVAGGRRVVLELTGPEGEDLDAALAFARAALPDGVELVERS